MFLVDKTFHKVSLALPVVGYLVVNINLDKQLVVEIVFVTESNVWRCLGRFFDKESNVVP